MGTSATIVLKTKTAYVGIYCHYDGYIKGGVGEMLKRHYKSKRKIKKLMALGNISSLQSKLLPRKHDKVHPIYNVQRGVTVSYIRDMQGCKHKEKAQRSQYLKDFMDTDYTYVFEDYKWTCMR